MVARLNRERPLPSPSEPRVTDGALQRALSGLYVALKEVVTFLQPYVQPQPWRKAELTSDWADIANSPLVSQMSYRKDPLGRVHLRGVAKQTGAPGSSVIFQLPEGYRPPKQPSFVVDSNLGAAFVGIYVDGRVEYQGVGGTPSTYLSLDGISFDTEE